MGSTTVDTARSMRETNVFPDIQILEHQRDGMETELICPMGLLVEGRDMVYSGRPAVAVTGDLYEAVTVTTELMATITTVASYEEALATPVRHPDAAGPTWLELFTDQPVGQLAVGDTLCLLPAVRIGESWVWLTDGPITVTEIPYGIADVEGTAIGVRVTFLPRRVLLGHAEAR